MVTNFGLRRLEDIKTPAYVYDVELLEATLANAKKAASKHGYHIHYALKANTDAVVLGRIRDAGFGADCVSGNEIMRAVKVGFPAKSIVFAGVGKTDEEIAYALDQGIYCFNCETIEEIEVINELAAERGKIANIALRLNPNIKAGGHEYITTGTVENKFGIQEHDLEYYLSNFFKWNNIKCVGLHFHIGSQIVDNQPFVDLAHKANNLVRYVESRGVGIRYLNLGGGLGVDYVNPQENPIPDFESYFDAIASVLNVEDKEVHFELGRSLVAQSGSLVTKVLYTKRGLSTDFLIVDAGMTELLRPALYQAQHEVKNLSKIADKPSNLYDVVGPVCESSDCFGKSVALPESKRGDYMIIRTCGAYAQSMSLQYNLRNTAQVYYDDSGLINQLLSSSAEKKQDDTDSIPLPEGKQNSVSAV